MKIVFALFSLEPQEMCRLQEGDHAWGKIWDVCCAASKIMDLECKNNEWF